MDKVGLRGNFESLQMGLNIHYRNSLCHLQACVGASRVRYKLKKELSDKTKLRVIKKVACEAWAVYGKEATDPFG